MKFSNLYRIYTNLKIAENQILTLDGDIYHYCKSVLRMKLSEKFRIFNEVDGEFLVQIIELNRRDLKVFISTQLRAVKTETQLILAMGIIKSDRFVEALKSAVQLGVTKIFPIISEYTQFKTINQERLKKCIIESTKQSKRLIPAILNEPTNLYDFISRLDIQDIVFGNENEQAVKINSIKDFNNLSAVLIGPEGGFSQDEQKQLLQNEKIISVTLGKTVLRTEVAVCALIACINLIRC